MTTNGQTINDRLNALRYALVGQGLARTVCKATTEECLGPKKKHIDYLLACTDEPNVSIPQLANLLFERTQHSNWAVVFKALISIHQLMSNGNERFTQYLATSNHSFAHLCEFMDRSSPLGYSMSGFVRTYANYVNEKILTYRTLAIDLCKIKAGADNALRTMNLEHLSKTLPIVQTQFDALLKFGAESKDLSNGVILAAFKLLYKDLVKIYIAYQEAIINLLERYFKLSRKKTRDALELYKAYVERMDKVVEFLKLVSSLGLDKSEMPDLKTPASILPALESHLAQLESKKKGGNVTPESAAQNTEVEAKKEEQEQEQHQQQKQQERNKDKDEEQKVNNEEQKQPEVSKVKNSNEKLEGNENEKSSVKSPSPAPPHPPPPKETPKASTELAKPRGSPSRPPPPQNQAEKKGPPSRPAPPSRPPPPTSEQPTSSSPIKITQDQQPTEDINTTAGKDEQSGQNTKHDENEREQTNDPTSTTDQAIETSTNNDQDKTTETNETINQTDNSIQQSSSNHNETNHQTESDTNNINVNESQQNGATCENSSSELNVEESGINSSVETTDEQQRDGQLNENLRYNTNDNQPQPSCVVTVAEVQEEEEEPVVQEEHLEANGNQSANENSDQRDEDADN